MCRRGWTRTTRRTSRKKRPWLLAASLRRASRNRRQGEEVLLANRMSLEWAVLATLETCPVLGAHNLAKISAVWVG